MSMAADVNKIYKTNAMVRPLEAGDLSAADHIMRLAFGTFLGMPEPATFMGEADYVRTRWRANARGAFCATVDGELAGSNFGSNWGSVGFFGPLTVHPKYWDQGVARQLIEPVMNCFESWGTKHAGLFTFSASQKHVALYQRFGFWPRFLTAVMSRPVTEAHNPPSWVAFSTLPAAEAESMLTHYRQLTNSIYDGLDVSVEIKSVAAQKLGETVLLLDDGKLAAFAVCHYGPGTEAAAGACYIKFGAAAPGSTASGYFADLLRACEAMSAQKGLARIVTGVNTARHGAYAHMLASGFKTSTLGVAMHRPNEAGYNRPDVFVVDDWR